MKKLLVHIALSLALAFPVASQALDPIPPAVFMAAAQETSKEKAHATKKAKPTAHPFKVGMTKDQVLGTNWIKAKIVWPLQSGTKGEPSTEMWDVCGKHLYLFFSNDKLSEIRSNQ